MSEATYIELVIAYCAKIYRHTRDSGVEAHIILAALFPIFIGAHASLSRPSSAARPKKEHGASSSDEDEEDTQVMEGMSARDAIIFPITAGVVLATLYWLIKRYGADVINLIMAWYFAGTGIFSVAKLSSDVLDLCFDLVMPTYYADRGRLFEVRGSGRKALTSSTAHPSDSVRTSPLPGRLGRITLSRQISSILWQIRTTWKEKFILKAYIKGLLDEKSTFTAVDAGSILIGVAVVAYSNFVDKLWWLTNIQGFAVSYFALQLISLTSFVVGSLVLSGLFFYDIWAVFFTPLMVTVATNLKQPIMLLFPRPAEEPDIPFVRPSKSFSMLGLGDIVLPGLMIALALRFDLYMFYMRKQTKKLASDGSKTEEIQLATYTPARGQWAARFWTMMLPRDALPEVLRNACFSKPYFTAAMAGYSVGMITTVAVMTFFQHAQPALLYLVPAVLISLWGTAAVKGELKDMWSYSEELTGEAVGGSVKDDAMKPDGQKEVEETWWVLLRKLLGIDSSSAESGKSISKESHKEEAKPEEAQMQADMVAPGTIALFSVVKKTPVVDTGKQEIKMPFKENSKQDSEVLQT